MAGVIKINSRLHGHTTDNSITGGHGPLEVALARKLLYPVYQPIVDLADSVIFAHEALIRGPNGTPLHTPDALILAAADENLSYEFEYAAVEAAFQIWSSQKAPGRLFVNISANALMQLVNSGGKEYLERLIRDFEILPRMLVLEITEHERVVNMDQFSVVAQSVRDAGASIALDDFGDGRSSLRLWSQIKPEIVKIDKFFTKDIGNDGDKLKTIQALQQIATTFGSELVAEGIETAQDMRVLRDLGIRFGQGYFLGYPEREPTDQIPAWAQSVLIEKCVSVFPEVSRSSGFGQIRNLPLVPAPTVSQSTTNDELAAVFLSHPSLHGVAVLEGDKPLGLINRSHFMNEYSKLYFREVWGRKSCWRHANSEPRLIERDHSIDHLLGILTSQDQRYLTDGFIVTENGRYVGLGTGDQLVRSVTETRIEAARHANPLTSLPGNIPISQHIERLLKRGAQFVACYADLNNFKPYNDYYGYWRGDEMIRLVAQIAVEQCDARRDFIGHVGGDDFILLFQSSDWLARTEALVSRFNEQAKKLFDEDCRNAGGIQAEDRYGILRFFECTTVSIGAVCIDGARYSRAEEVANLAALAKHEAKRNGSGVFQLEVPGIELARTTLTTNH